MQGLRQSDWLAIDAVNTRDELCARVVHMTRKLGFQTVSLTLVLDRVGGDPEFLCVDNTPAGYAQMFADLERGRRDPVSQHCKVSPLPIVWDQQTYVQAGRASQWEHQAQFGYRTGISIAHHLPGGRHVLLGVDRSEPLPGVDAEERLRLLGGVQLLATYALEPALRLLAPRPTAEAVTLTPREVEVLSWTMEGKTAWEIGRILGIAENTVIRHLQAATHKLDCSNKLHAVVKAMRLGLIR